MKPRLRLPISSRRALAAALVAITASTAMVPVGAQGDVDDARARREQIQRESAELAAQIDELNAEDEEIVAALDQIDTWVGAQESRLAAARQELAVTREREADANARADELDTRIDELQIAVADQLVASYIGGFRNDDELILGSADINVVPLLRFAIDESTGTSMDTTDLLRAAGAQQAEAIAEAEQATADAERLEDEIEERIVELEASRTAQERLRAEVAARIAELEETTAVLAAEDQQIAEFIRAEEERARRAEEERRRQEELRRLEAERQAEAERLAEEERTRQEEEEQQAEQDGGDEPAPDAGDEPEPEPEPEPPPRPDTTGAPDFSPPVNAPISSGFGYRIHPIYGTSRLHTGLDYSAPNGSPIASAAPGTVIFVGFYSGYGNTVIVQHGGGYTTLYAHMSGFNVSQGASVATGDTVGFVGSTGLSTGPHLHFEIRLNGNAIDPLPLL